MARVVGDEPVVLGIAERLLECDVAVVHGLRRETFTVESGNPSVDIGAGDLRDFALAERGQDAVAGDGDVGPVGALLPHLLRCGDGHR